MKLRECLGEEDVLDEVISLSRASEMLYARCTNNRIYEYVKEGTAKGEYLRAIGGGKMINSTGEEGSRLFTTRRWLMEFCDTTGRFAFVEPFYEQGEVPSVYVGGLRYEKVKERDKNRISRAVFYEENDVWKTPQETLAENPALVEEGFSPRLVKQSQKDLNIGFKGSYMRQSEKDLLDNGVPPDIPELDGEALSRLRYGDWTYFEGCHMGAPVVFSDSFCDFMDVYPKKSGIAAAADFWDKQNYPKRLQAQITAAAGRLARHYRDNAGSLTVYPTPKRFLKDKFYLLDIEDYLPKKRIAIESVDARG